MLHSRRHVMILNLPGTPLRLRHACSSLSISDIGLWECSSFVEELEIRGCKELVRWPVEELRSLARLRSLHIWCCKKLEGKGSSSEETLPLPQLERLVIFACGSLLEIPKLPPSLEDLSINGCSRLVALPWNESLKALADGNEMDGLTSLVQLTIAWCPGIEEFPQGLLQRLPTLKSLFIVCCHAELHRRCREGGEYFHLVSSIPEKRISEGWRPQQEEAGSSMKKLVRRLLPSCAHSN